VIKGRAGPVGGGMADGAVLRKPGGLMVWIGRAVVVGLVAVNACGARQIEVAVDVALRALKAGVRSR